MIFSNETREMFVFIRNQLASNKNIRRVVRFFVWNP